MSLASSCWPVLHSPVIGIVNTKDIRTSSDLLNMIAMRGSRTDYIHGKVVSDLSDHGFNVRTATPRGSQPFPLVLATFPKQKSCGRLKNIKSTANWPEPPGFLSFIGSTMSVTSWSWIPWELQSPIFPSMCPQGSFNRRCL